MRLTTIASVALLAASSAALAQVASSPAEQKLSPGNTAQVDATPGNDMLLNDTSLAQPATATGNEVVEDALSNDAGLPDAAFNAANTPQ